MKHIEVRALHLQDLMKRKVLRVTNWPGPDNPADLGTKPLAQARLERLPLLEMEDDRPFRAMR